MTYEQPGIKSETTIRRIRVKSRYHRDRLAFRRREALRQPYQNSPESFYWNERFTTQ